MPPLVSSLIICAALAGAVTGFAADPQPAADSTSMTITLPPILSAAPAATETQGVGAQPVSAPAAPARPRAISSGVAAMLATNMPKFVPQAPKPASADGDVDSQYENEQPRNGIIRLPKMVVREPRPIIFSERAIHTKQGLADLAFRRYISETDRALNRFTLPLFGISAQARALQMYAEDERLRNMSNLDDAVRIVSLTDEGGGMYLKRAAQQTYMRTQDFGWSSRGPE